MKYIRTFESHKTVKGNLKAINPSILEEAIKESVINVGDIYKVRSMVDIPQSLINSYVKKVKDTTGKNLRQFFGDVEIAEELVKHITTSGLEIDKIAGNALMGGAQGQGQAQGQVQVDTQAETQPLAQEPVQEVPAQAEGQVPAQAEGQAPAQEEGQPVAQPSAQFEEPAQAQEGQAPAQPATQEEEEEEEEKEGEEGQEEEELPL
jgi:hypothetical protein